MSTPTIVALKAPASGYTLIARDGQGNRALYVSGEDGTYRLEGLSVPESEYWMVEVRDPSGMTAATMDMVEDGAELRLLRPGENPVSLAHRIAALEAAVAGLQGRTEPDPVPDEVPGELEEYRLEGETDEALRARLASRLRDLRNKLFLGAITDEERVLLTHLESVGWLGE